jgi:general secretion pathway protein B
VATQEPLRTLSDLPAPQREAAERLRIGVHVYATQPRSRLVMIDGRPLHEGDELAEGLILDEITQAGVVLRHRTVRVLSPVASRSP